MGRPTGPRRNGNNRRWPCSEQSPVPDPTDMSDLSRRGPPTLVQAKCAFQRIRSSDTIQPFPSSGVLMGLTTAKIELRNPRLPDLPPVIVDALADTGSDHVCIPEHIRRLLALEQADTKRVTLADGTSRAAPYVGPLQLRFGNRTGFAGGRSDRRSATPRCHRTAGHGPGGCAEDTPGRCQSLESRCRDGQREGDPLPVPSGDQRDFSVSSINAICSSVTGSNCGITHRGPQEPPKPQS